MASIFSREEGTRWPRGQKFQITENGREAEARYQEALRVAHEKGGRAAFDEATAVWAGPLGVRPGDGAYLAELKEQARTVVDLVEQLQDGGATKVEVKAALDRLIAAKLAEPTGG